MAVKVGTFNLRNLARARESFYPDERPYSEAEYERKATWTAEQLRRMDADLVGFQEVFHDEALRDVCGRSGRFGDGTVTAPGADGASGPRLGLATALTWPSRSRRSPTSPPARTRRSTVSRCRWGRSVVRCSVPAWSWIRRRARRRRCSSPTWSQAADPGPADRRARPPGGGPGQGAGPDPSRRGGGRPADLRYVDDHLVDSQLSDDRAGRDVSDHGQLVAGINLR